MYTQLKSDRKQKFLPQLTHLIVQTATTSHDFALNLVLFVPILCVNIRFPRSNAMGHYCLICHTLDPSPSSGQACSLREPTHLSLRTCLTSWCRGLEYDQSLPYRAQCARSSPPLAFSHPHMFYERNQIPSGNTCLPGIDPLTKLRPGLGHGG